MNASGAARTTIDIVDYSVLIDTGLKGRAGFAIETERGIPGKPYEIGNWDQFQIDLGGLVAGNDGPLYARRALEAGSPLTIIPIGKYSDPSNKATLTGIKAFYTLTQATAAAVAGTAVTTASTPTGSVAVGVYVSRPGLSDVTLASGVALTNANTATTAAAAIVSAINAGTGTHGYTAANVAGAITVTAPTTNGAFVNRFLLKVLSDSNAVFGGYSVSFAGATDATQSTGTFTGTALTRGTAYNGATIKFSSAISNSANLYDITVSLPGSKAPDEVIRDVPKLASDATFANIIAGFVANSRLVSSLAFSNTFVIQPGTYTLASGTNGTTVTASDYMGDRTGQTNIYAFDSVSNVTRIFTPAVADPILAKSLSDYADARKDLRAIHRTPLGLTPQRELDYRYGTGSYNHVPIDSWRSLMFSQPITVVDPLTGLTRDISAIGDIAGAMASKDRNYHEWFSFAGETRGIIGNVLGLPFNLGSVGNKDYADSFDFAGIIPVVQNSKKLIYISGDNSLYRHETLLKKSNVGDLLIFMYRSIMELIPQNFDPNDVETWKGIYRTLQPFLDYLKSNRAIFAYDYKGDQDIMDVSQAVINTTQNIDAGQYKFIIGVKPKVNLKYIDLTIGVANSGANFDDISIRS